MKSDKLYDSALLILRTGEPENEHLRASSFYLSCEAEEKKKIEGEGKKKEGLKKWRRA